MKCARASCAEQGRGGGNVSALHSGVTGNQVGTQQSQSNNKKIGLVVPIFQTKYISPLIKSIAAQDARPDLAVCIVNDGKPEVAEFLAGRQWPDFVEILNLPENRRFAGANNAGWRQLITNHPEVRFLGTINDDTRPRKGWLDALVEALEKYPRAGMSMPVMGTSLGPLRTRKDFATWRLGQGESALIIAEDNTITQDKFVSAVNGYCLMAARQALEEAGFFDEGFNNSCEDLDLGIKMLKAGWRLVVSHKAWVFHYGQKSRKIKGASTDVSMSRALLESKWGKELSKYNLLDGEGFLIETPPRT